MRVRTKGKAITNSSEVKIPQRLSLKFLDLLCSYLVSTNRNIRYKGYSNVLNAMKTLDLSIFQDDEYMLRFDFIRCALNARIDNGLDNNELVLDYIETTIGDSFKNVINLRELNNKEVDYVNATVSTMLDNVVFAKNIMSFENIATRYKEAGPNDKQMIIVEWKDLVDESKNAIRQNKINKSDEQMYSLQHGPFEDYVMYTHADLSSPYSRLATGMMGFNQMLNGGFQSNRVYCIFGLQGEGKSSTLVDLSYQIKMYNKTYKTKDPTKKPCVVYLTMEDHPKETLSRQFSMVTEQGSLIDHDPHECISLMRQGGLDVTPDNPIDIIVQYKPNESVDTSYLYDLVDDLDDMGYECICIILDYLNRIRSVNRYSASEERLRLGAVVNELKTIATELGIPVITAAQFNREANKNIDDARENGKEDLVDLLGRNNIAESMKILDNLDGAFLIVPEKDINGNKYLGIKLAKHRWQVDYDTPLLTVKNVIHHPYTDNHSMRLMEDVLSGSPCHKMSLVELQQDDMIVDEDIIPDNSNRYNPAIAEQTKSALCKEAGIKNNSNVTVIGTTIIPNVDTKKKKGKVAECNPAPDRYSDLYTKLYDPNGSKMKRYVDDYNKEFGTSFNEIMYEYVKDTRNFMRLSKKDDSPYEGMKFEKGVLYTNPFKRITYTNRQPFTRITSSCGS